MKTLKDTLETEYSDTGDVCLMERNTDAVLGVPTWG